MSESTGPAYAEGTGPAYNEATPYPFNPDGQPRMYTNGRDHMVILDERSGFRIATPSEIANAFWSLWWGANSKPTVDQIEAVQTACKVVEELTGESDG